jgi:hypothetical protein
MIRETISTAVATCATVLLAASGGAVTPWHGAVLFIVALIFGAVALVMIEED